MSKHHLERDLATGGGPAAVPADRASEAPPVVAPRILETLVNHIEEHLPAPYGPRQLHLSAAQHPEADLFITSRNVVDLREPGEPNVVPHTHPVSQTYLLVSEDGSLEIEGEVDGRAFVARAPSAVVVPPGAPHWIRILRGTGALYSIVRAGEYLTGAT